ncbi:MAG: YggT family protein [Chloroflexi bacterium]|nr:MAG: YggT family protein [Chloroflexota bacterium]TMD55045.1 MAG: YggT family protein [Chloroflexota bacterium]
MATQQTSTPPAVEHVERVEQVSHVDHVSISEQSRYNYRAAAVVGFIVGVVDVLIAGRFLLKLLGASEQSSFVNLIYAVSSPLVAPFHGIFPNSGAAGNIFEPAALVAIAVFALLGWGVVVLIRIATAPRGTRPATS